jgi:hypothetical protein
MEVLMRDLFGEYTVFVRDYFRRRFGRKEHVCSHFRRWPRC